MWPPPAWCVGCLANAEVEACTFSDWLWSSVGNTSPLLSVDSLSAMPGLTWYFSTCVHKPARAPTHSLVHNCAALSKRSFGLLLLATHDRRSAHIGQEGSVAQQGSQGTVGCCGSCSPRAVHRHEDGGHLRGVLESSIQAGVLRTRSGLSSSLHAMDLAC